MIELHTVDKDVAYNETQPPKRYKAALCKSFSCVTSHTAPVTIVCSALLTPYQGLRPDNPDVWGNTLIAEWVGAFTVMFQQSSLFNLFDIRMSYQLR
jgi:hypothetical protein